MPTSGVEAVIDRVMQVEADEIRRTISEAVDAALKLIDDYELKARSRYEEVMLEGKKEAENERRKMLGSAELEARNLLLQAFEAFFDSAVEGALQEVASLPRDSRYVKAMVRLLQEAISELEEGRYVVQCSARDKEAVSKAMASLKDGNMGYELTMASKYTKSAGGIIVRSEDGMVEYDNTFESRLERLKPAIRRRVFEKYFKEGR
jgi:V/A-type H+-transporting ATPase subunit E